jgi:hypothetical protein
MELLLQMGIPTEIIILQVCDALLKSFMHVALDTNKGIE